MGVLFVLTRIVGIGGAGVVEREAVIAIVNVDIQPGEGQRVTLVQLQVTFQAQQLFINIIGVVPAGIGVVDVAIGAVLMRRQAHVQARPYFARYHHTQSLGVVVSQLARHHAFKVCGRIITFDIDHARQRIGTKAGALWATQHFDLLHIKQTRATAQSGHIDAIPPQPHRRVHRIDKLGALTNTANLEITTTGSAGREVHVRSQRQQAFQMIGGTLFDGGRTDHGSGFCNGLHIGLTKVSRHDHFFGWHLTGTVGMRWYGNCHRQHGQR